MNPKTRNNLLVAGRLLTILGLCFMAGFSLVQAVGPDAEFAPYVDVWWARRVLGASFVLLLLSANNLMKT
jgi:hypothetical protein